MAGTRRPRNQAALDLAAAQGDIGAARIRIEQIRTAAVRLAEDCSRVLSEPPFMYLRPAEDRRQQARALSLEDREQVEDRAVLVPLLPK
jgi:hypothetical protein